MKFSQKLLVGLISLLLFSCGDPPLNKSPELGDELEKAFRDSKSVGATVILTSSDSIVFEKYLGYADVEVSRPVTNKSLFGIGSISKTFASLAVLKLVEEGKFQLEDKISDLLPELLFQNKYKHAHPLRLVHLLEHTSGFDDLHPKDWTFPVEDDDFSLEEAVKMTRNSMSPRWKPGTRFAYSNVNYLLIGYLVEKYSDHGYDAFLREKIFSPIGMDNSSARSDELDLDHIAKSYRTREKALPFKHIIARPAGSIFSSGEEMAKFLQVMLKQPDDFLSTASFAELEKHHSIPAFSATENGFRLGLKPTYKNGRLWLGHGGAINNYKSIFHYNRELDLGLFVVSNGPNSPKCLELLEKEVFKYIAKLGQTDSFIVHQPVEHPEKYTGYFSFGSPRVQLLYPFAEFFTEGIRIKDYDGRLFLVDKEKNERPLYRTAPGRFSINPQEAGFEMVFPQDQPGVMYSSLGFYYQKSSHSGLVILAGALLLSLLLALFSQLIFFFRVFYQFKGKTRVLPAEYFLAGSSFLLVLGIVAFLFTPLLENLHEPQLSSIFLYLSSLIFPFLAAAGLLLWIKDAKNFKALNWTFQGILGIGLLFMAAHLYYWDMLGFAYWTY